MAPSLLTLTPPDAAWMAKAACRDRWGLTDAETEYTERAARELCQGCPVLQRCGRWVMSLPPAKDVYGVAAGLTAKERELARRTIRRRRAAPVETDLPKKCNSCGEVKAADQYYQRPRDRCGREARCIECRRKQNREHKAAKRAAGQTTDVKGIAS